MFDRVLNRLELFLEKDGWNGWDPYDGLNSNFLKGLTFNSKFLKIAATQAMKRSPVNLRPLFAVPKSKNPKAMGLLASAYLKRYKNHRQEKYLDKAREILDWLIAHSSAGYSGYCWGYNFDWQSSVFYVPKGVPTIVNTSFIANAFLDAYEIMRDRGYLDVARSCCDFVLNDLYRTPFEKVKNDPITNDLMTSGVPFCFSYSPVDRQCVHNANLLAAEMLSRVYHFVGENNLRRSAELSAKFSASQQNPAGSWNYGSAKEETYVDNFHTGFVLVSLANIAKYTDIENKTEYLRTLLKGYDYYKKTFFSDNGMPYYYADSIYPIDLHCSAQGIITCVKFLEYDRDAIIRAKEIANWAIKNMWDEKEGYFYFQKVKLLTNHHLTNKIPYFRWPNVWMYYALALLNLSLSQ